jgi:hypothetical protein
MPLPAFEQIEIDSPRLQVYRNYNKYDDYLKENDPTYYERLSNPLIAVINDVPIQNRMIDAIYFFASKGVGELTQILKNFDISGEIINGVQKYFGPDYGAMNGGLRTKLDVAGRNLDFNEILALYENIVNPNLANRYIYNTLKAFTKTTPSEELFYVFRCYQRLPNGAPLFEANGTIKPIVYLNQFTSTSILLRLCDFWCTPSPINFSNNTDPTNYQLGDNTIICIEIPIGTRGISLINYAGIVDEQLTTTYSEFEYLLPPGGTLELTDTTYTYESITRAQLEENYVQRGLNGRFLNLPIRFNIPIYRYVSVEIPDNRTQKSILHRAYVYILPIRGFLIRTINYVRDRTTRMSARLSNFLRGNRNPYGMLVEAEGRRLRRPRKITRKYTKKQPRKYSRKRARKNSIRKKYKIEI